MKTKYFFESDKISYSDFLKTIQVMLQHNHFFCKKDCIERGVEALSKIDEDSKERLIKTAVKVDKNFSVAGTDNRNCAHKLPIILKSADLIVNYGDKVQNLSNEELILISDFFSYYQIPQSDKRFDFFFDKEVLKTIREKTNNFSEQRNILIAVDMKLDDLNVKEMDDLQYTIASREMLNTIKNSNAEELIKMVDIIGRTDKTMQESNFR